MAKSGFGRAKSATPGPETRMCERRSVESSASARGAKSSFSSQASSTSWLQRWVRSGSSLKPRIIRPEPLRHSLLRVDEVGRYPRLDGLSRAVLRPFAVEDEAVDGETKSR